MESYFISIMRRENFLMTQLNNENFLMNKIFRLVIWNLNWGLQNIAHAILLNSSSLFSRVLESSTRII